jgi:hypothetical protein
MNLVGLLVAILVIGLVFSLCVWMIDQVPAFAPFKSMARAILALIAIILLLAILFGGIAVPGLRIS